MSKKSRTEITEKLNALKPGEPTRTRGKSVRKSPAIKIRLQEGGSPQDTQPSPEPQRGIWPPMIAMFSVPSEREEIYRAVYEGWLRYMLSCSGMVADCNRMFLSSLSRFMDSNRWGQS